MYKIYGHPYSQHSRRVVALLEAAGLAFEFQAVDLGQSEHRTPQFLAINPNHQVPVLVENDFKLTESNAILRFLCARHGLTDWYPEDVRTRARVDQWLDWNQCRLSPSVIDIVLNSVFLGDEGDPEAIERGHLMMEELGPILAAGLEDRAFLAGDHPTIADLSVASNITQLGLAGAQPQYAPVQQWYQRVSEIEGFQRALPQAA